MGMSTGPYKLGHARGPSQSPAKQSSQIYAVFIGLLKKTPKKTITVGLKHCRITQVYLE
uniref:Uncharacterized protein n=1 Tax=Anguilla anguilla TaxID=7936 RepID=A0A0E9S224_ANGAN